MNSKYPRIILCIDDDPDDRELLTVTIEELMPTYRVLPALHGKDALAKLRELNSIDIYPCLIILDINMPIMDGRETLCYLKNEDRWKNIPVVIFTTSPKEMLSDLYLKYDVTIIEKPVSNRALIRSVIEILSHCANEDD